MIRRNIANNLKLDPTRTDRAPDKQSLTDEDDARCAARLAAHVAVLSDVSGTAFFFTTGEASTVAAAACTAHLRTTNAICLVAGITVGTDLLGNEGYREEFNSVTIGKPLPVVTRIVSFEER